MFKMFNTVEIQIVYCHIITPSDALVLIQMDGEKPHLETPVMAVRAITP